MIPIGKFVLTTLMGNEFIKKIPYNWFSLQTFQMQRILLEFQHWIDYLLAKFAAFDAIRCHSIGENLPNGSNRKRITAAEELHWQYRKWRIFAEIVSRSSKLHPTRHPTWSLEKFPIRNLVFYNPHFHRLWNAVSFFSESSCSQIFN